MPGRPFALFVVLAGVLSVLLAVATDLATDLLPERLRLREPYAVLAWSVVGMLAAATIVLGVWQAVVESRRPAAAIAEPGGNEPQSGRWRGPDRRARVVPAQLPPDISEFTGRRQELELLQRQLVAAATGSPPTMVIAAVAGKPGVGKSALAIHLAHRIAGHYPDGRLYVNLRGASGLRLDPAEALGRFLRAFGVRDDHIPVGLDEQVALYRSQLYGRRVLVVLDDAADAAQVRPLLPGSPGCAVLVTSRSPLATLEGAVALNLELLDTAEAIELLGKVAGPARVEAEPDAAAAIARHCGRLPLALRIAGGKLAARPGWSLAAFEARLVDERRRLAELRVGDLEVRASFDLSYAELEERDARAFRLLSLLDGNDVTPEVAAALTEVGLDSAEDTLDRLADSHLVEAPVPGRYRFHDLLRLFARERSAAEDPPPQRKAALARAFHHYLEAAGEAVATLSLGGDGGVSARPPATGGGGGPAGRGRGRFADPDAAIEWLLVERPNLVAAVRQAAESGSDLPAWDLALTIAPFLELRKYWPEWEATGELALRAARAAGDRAAEGLALENLGLALRDQRQYLQALECLQQSHEIFRELGDRAGECRVLLSLGTTYRDLDRFEDALACYERALPVVREAGGRLGEARLQEGLGAVYRHQGRLDEARSCFEWSVKVFGELNDRRREGRSYGQLGRTYAALGMVDEAMAAFARGLACVREAGDRHNEARSLFHLGRFHASQGRAEEAATCFDQAAEVFADFGDRYHEGVARKFYGTVLADLGDSDEARDQWRMALTLLGPRDASHAAELRAWLEG